MANILNINDRVTCSRKGHLIAVVKRNIPTTDLVRLTKDLEFEPGQDKVPGQALTCETCGSVWQYQGRFHTENGWQPDDPRLEPVSQR